MNNPFANFDLEESLSGLPEGLRQPMVLAVIASGLVHGFTFLLLPMLTTSAEGKQLETERVVSVLELTPEEQARLPVSMTAVNPMINSKLPPGALGKVPLTGLFPSSNLPGIKLTPNPNPVNDFFSKVNTNSSGGSSSLGLGTYSYSEPLFSGGSSGGSKPLTSEERKELEQFQKDKAAAEKAAKDKAEADKKNQNPIEQDQNKDPKGQTKVEPGNQNNSPLPPQTQQGTPASPSPNPSPSPTVPQPTPELIAATQYAPLPEGAEKPEYITQQSQQLQNAILANQMPEALRNLPSDDPKRREWETQNQDQLGQTAFYLAQVQPKEVPLQSAPLPPGITEFKFNGAAPQAQVSAVIEVYVTPEGKLMAEPTLIRSSGFKHLDDTALSQIKEAITKVPLKQPVRYTVPFQLPQGKPTA